MPRCPHQTGAAWVVAGGGEMSTKGRLYYDSAFEVDFDDGLLAHLQVVIRTKLAKNESFYLT